jgi:hypothetical protein
MPFLDDSGARPEQETNLLWRSTALISDQLERMIALNLAWSLQLAPLCLAVLAPLPGWARALLASYSIFAILPATGALLHGLEQAAAGVPLSTGLVIEGLRQRLRQAFTRLLPLYSLFYWLGLLAWYAGQAHLLVLDVLCRLLLLLLALVSLHWGGLFAREEQLSALDIFNRSLQLFWRKPGLTLLCGIYSLVALLLGIISIGGFFLIIPVLLGLLQVLLYEQVARPHAPAHNHSA